MTEITNKGIKIDIINMFYSSKMYKMRGEMKYMKKINQMEFLEMKNTRDRINRFSTTEEKIGEFADMKTNYPK